MSARRPARFFIDTNILVHTFDDTSPLIRAQARELVELALTTGLGIISYQVVQEFLSVATRRFAVPLSATEAAAYLERTLSPLCKVWPTAKLYRQALELSDDAGYSYYDSLVVASAIAGGCSTLYTQDMQTGRRFGPLTLVDPFA